MPEQKFFDPTSGDELVSVHWDFGLTSVDVASGGSLLTKISDIAQLRSTGLAGSTPDGGSLLVKLGFGDKFEIYRNGEELRASDVNAFGHAPTPTGTALGDAKLSLDAAGRLTLDGRRVDEHAMGMIPQSRRSRSSAASSISTARGWLLFFSVIQTLFALLFGFVATAVTSVTESDLAVTGDDADFFTPLLRIIQGMIIAMFVFFALCAIASWVLWKVAGGPSPRKAFTISKWVAVGYLVLTVIRTISGIASGNVLGAILGAVIPGAIEFAAFQAFRKAQSALG